MICDMKLKWQSIKCGSNAAEDFALVLIADGGVVVCRLAPRGSVHIKIGPS